MIATISGTVTQKSGGSAVIEAAGVGYLVHVTPTTSGALRTGEQARLWTHEHVREDSRELFGFLTQGDQRLFLRLLGVSGVGPKMAMNILSLGGADEVERAVEQSDVVRLSSAPGVGKKTAQKIVLDLKGKLVGVEGPTEQEEVLIALIGLGFDRERARDALVRVGADGSVEQRLRDAMRELGRK